MIRYIILAILLLAGCDRDCDAPGRPQYPEIGGCINGAVAGEAGGYCKAAPWGGPYYCNDGLTCIDATCYECGHIGQPCCGSQSSAEPGSCTEGTCAKPPGDEWFTCQGDAATPAPAACAPGDKPNYYVWTLTSTCAAAVLSFCAVDDAAAQAWVDANLGSVQHGPFGTNPDSIAPTPWYACGSGPNCIVGSSDGALVTTFFAFTHDQVVACESALDSGCAWVDAPNDTCPAQM